MATLATCFMFLHNCQLSNSGNSSSNSEPNKLYPKQYTEKSLLSIQDIPLPKNFFRYDTVGEMSSYCRKLPLKPKQFKVKLYNGALKNNQSAHYAILDIDVGKRDLQQCADAVMRIRAEYLFSKQQYDDIHFNFTSGDRCIWNKWKTGWRPNIKGNKVNWVQSQPKDDSYANFRKYLNTVFTYAGSASLSKEMISVEMQEMQIGDVLIQGGFPGHAVMVLDMAKNNKGEKIYILAQSYMPAQDIHVLVNPNDNQSSPWYALNNDDAIITPEWTFNKIDLKRFK